MHVGEITMEVAANDQFSGTGDPVFDSRVAQASIRTSIHPPSLREIRCLHIWKSVEVISNRGPWIVSCIAHSRKRFKENAQDGGSSDNAVKDRGGDYIWDSSYAKAQK